MGIGVSFRTKVGPENNKVTTILKIALFQGEKGEVMNTPPRRQKKKKGHMTRSLRMTRGRRWIGSNPINKTVNIPDLTQGPGRRRANGFQSMCNEGV